MKACQKLSLWNSGLIVSIDFVNNFIILDIVSTTAVEKQGALHSSFVLVCGFLMSVNNDYRDEKYSIRKMNFSRQHYLDNSCQNVRKIHALNSKWYNEKKTNSVSVNCDPPICVNQISNAEDLVFSRRKVDWYALEDGCCWQLIDDMEIRWQHRFQDVGLNWDVTVNCDEWITDWLVN